ncbi:MAG: hypothetical protein JWM34_3919 [Ilumatobacteraceae bacterium]|nr:hypothetical protein [Ilumatobacteraceae bacterium]
MMQLLATAPEIVFDRRYPAEYRFFSYLARMSEAMTEPFDDQQHPGVTEFFFGPERQLSPIPFRSDVVAFTARGIEGFGRVAGQSEADYLDQYVETLRAQYELMAKTASTVDRVLIRYEDCATSLLDVAQALGSWLGVRLDATVVLAQRSSYAHHTTTPTVQDSIGRWQHDLSTTEASHIKHVLGPLLTELGYHLPPASHP